MRESYTVLIESAIKTLNEAWNAKNPRDFAYVFTEDAIFTNVLGDVAKGKQEIEEMHIYPFNNPLKDAYLEYTIQHIKQITEDAAIIDFRWDTYNQKVPGTDRILPPRHGLQNAVVMIEGDQGKIKAAYNTDYTGTYQRTGKQEGDVRT